MPDVATIIDFMGPPSEYTYSSDVVHVVWNDDLDPASPPHILYTASPDAGVSWPMPFEDVTLMSQAAGWDGYPSLTVDRDDFPHVAWMTELWPHDPDSPGPYTPGANPAVVNSFPGPDPGMYGALGNFILYSWRLGGMWSPVEIVSSMTTDDEFPSIAVDPYNLLWIGYQMFDGMDYEIGLATKPIGAPSWNLANVSMDFEHDDLFPSTATKKAGTSSPGFDLTWTKIDSDGSAGGHGPGAALSPAHEIWFAGNTAYSPPVAIGNNPEGSIPGDFHVYPNPVLAGAWIFTGESSGLIKIFDLSGRVVFRESIMPESNDNLFWGAACSDGTPVPNGHYIVTLQNGDMLKTLSIIVAR
ncbi:hypothetical protein DRQ25_14960 [Candidatus Fermentibacteria bacterium]|nr:MAG: hypothetical protein DRQ25_14960 [Candidatus Fermentibacteria bacterium]